MVRSYIILLLNISGILQDSYWIGYANHFRGVCVDRAFD